MTTYTMQGRVVPHAERLAKIERLAYHMDENIALLGTDKRIGLEALLGLIPGLGDLATAVVSLHIISEARKVACQKRSCRR